MSIIKAALLYDSLKEFDELEEFIDRLMRLDDVNKQEMAKLRDYNYGSFTIDLSEDNYKIVKDKFGNRCNPSRSEEVIPTSINNALEILHWCKEYVFNDRNVDRALDEVENHIKNGRLGFIVHFDKPEAHMLFQLTWSDYCSPPR